MYCLDTSVLVDFFRNDAIIIQKLNELSDECALFISTPILCELYKGSFISSKSNKDIASVKDFLSFVEIADFNIEACEWFGKEYARLQKLGRTPPEIDLMIASIAKTNGLTLITRDKRDFLNIDIKVEVW